MYSNITHNYPAGPFAAGVTGLCGLQHDLGLSAGDGDAGRGDRRGRENTRLSDTARGSILLLPATVLIAGDVNAGHSDVCGGRDAGLPNTDHRPALLLLATGLSAGDVNAGRYNCSDGRVVGLPSTDHRPALLLLATGLVGLDGGLPHQLCLVLLFCMFILQIIIFF